MAEIDVVLRLKDLMSNAMAQAAGNTERQVKLMDTNFRGLTRTIGNIGTVLAGGWLGKQVVDSINHFSKATEESEIVTAKLNAALGGNVTALTGQADAVAVSLGLDDEAIIRMQALLGGYTKNKVAIEALTPAILDMAEGLGIDMSTAATMVGKALRNDNDELARYKIHVDGAAGSQDRALSIANALTNAWGGQAKAANDASDKSKNVQAAMGNVAEAIGEQVLPEVRQLNAELASFANNTLVPLGKIISHVLVDPFRMASISIMTVAQGLGYAYIASQKLGQLLQQKGTPVWNEYQKSIEGTQRWMAALDEEITSVSAKILGIKEVKPVITPREGFDVGGKQKKVMTWAEIQKKSAEESEKAIEAQAAAGTKVIEDEISVYIKWVEEQDSAAKEIVAIDQQITDAKTDLHEYRMKLLEDETKKTEETLRRQLSFWSSYANMLGGYLNEILEANKGHGRKAQKIAYSQAGINAAMAQGGAAASIWGTPGGTWQEKLVESIAISAALWADFAAQLVVIGQQSFATGTMFAPGGVARVHQDETIYLPRGSRVDTAAQSRGMPPMTININGPVTREAMPALNDSLRQFSRTLERATAGGYIDAKRLARYAR